MIFTVTYRDPKTGDRETLELDVPDKGAVWPAIKERGISAISVAEGKTALGKKPMRKAKGAPRRSGARSPILRAATAGLIVIIGGLAIFYFMNRSPEKKVEPPKPAPKPVPKVETPPPKPKTNPAPQKVEEKLKPGERRHVKWTKPANWDQMTPAQRTRAQPVGRVIRPKWMDEKKLFTKMSDQKIHRLLRVKPGQLFLGTATYDDRFVKTFLESLKEPIEFAEDDTPEEREMKQAVIDTRKELKEAYDRGEDIAAIMRETEKQMHEQAAYRLDLRRAVVEYKKSGEHTDQDVKDYIEAANTILKENGMEPLKLGNFWYHKAKIDSQTEETK